LNKRPGGITGPGGGAGSNGIPGKAQPIGDRRTSALAAATGAAMPAATAFRNLRRSNAKFLYITMGTQGIKEHFSFDFEHLFGRFMRVHQDDDRPIVVDFDFTDMICIEHSMANFD
jgi:hypothetical protein